MIYVTVRVDDPFHVSGVKTGFPYGLDQHGGCSAIAAVDQEQSIPGIDQVDAYPAVPDEPDWAVQPERRNITVFLVLPDRCQCRGSNMFPMLQIEFLILLDRHNRRFLLIRNHNE